MTQNHSSATSPVLQLKEVSAGYGDAPLLQRLSLSIAPGSFTAVVGANGSGKSTLLRVLCGILAPRCGAVLLDGSALRSMRRKAVARRIAYLPQDPQAPDLITVGDLVSRGRYPYQSLLRPAGQDDARAIAHALRITELTALASRPLQSLSGGQRQRAWLALVLAQDTEVLLLDEPTSFLDLQYQLELMELCASLHRSGRTIITVLHDLNLAFRYAPRIIMMKQGRVVAHACAQQAVTPQNLRDVFHVDCRVMIDPLKGTPMLLPTASLGRARTV